MRFKDKVVLVTGASKGIGRATAILFAKEGAKVVVNYNNSKEEAEKVLSEIKKVSDGIIVKCDVSKEGEVSKMFQETLKKFGKLDILVNNAGIVFDVPFKDRTVEHWKRTLDVDLIGVFICAKEAVKYMKNGGRIVNISSTSGINTWGPDSMDYASAKAGVIMLTNTLAQELAPKKIYVNCVAPGWIDTEMNKDLPKEYVEQEKERTFMKRFAQPEEVGKAVLFLASDDASFITGSTLIVDGGFH
jgi:NAD(P)-dependent dehydrogenase (short-subunit alcohol dehydrogenase family)